MHILRQGAPQASRYSASRNVRVINFFCTAAEAKCVSVIGDFNQWNPTADPMQRQPDGRWLGRVQLHHGHHHYLFLVDGERRLDPNAGGIARNEHNERVSLIAVS